MKSKLSHVNKRGEANMVSIAQKKVTRRKAIAHARIDMNKQAFDAIKNNMNKFLSKMF